jgi:hypothetical protein
MPFQSSLAHADLQQQQLLVPFSKPPILCTSPTNLSQNPHTIKPKLHSQEKGTHNFTQHTILPNNTQLSHAQIFSKKTKP